MSVVVGNASIEALLQFEYGNAFLLELTAVLVLQVLLYLIATGSVGSLYKICSAMGIGGAIEPRPTYPAQIGHEVLWSMSTCFVIAVYMYFALSFIADVYPASFVAASTQVIGFIVLYDFYMYVTHRALHGKILRRFHARHHRAISATPWSCLNMHPIEAVINYLPFLVFAATTPVSLVVFLGIHVYLIFGIANGHGNYSVSDLDKTPFLLRELTTFHQRHHSDGKGNFGYLFTHWDLVFGTRHS